MGHFSDLHAAQANPGSSARRKQRERQREQERQQQQQVQAVEETVQAVEQAIEETATAPEAIEIPDPGRFEEWLETQKDREDSVGKVARFVLADIERGCWRETFKAPDYLSLLHGSDWVERSKKYCVEHLIAHHDAYSHSLAIFREVWAEFLKARWEYETRNFRTPATPAEHPADFN